ncbi:MotA/TolQ/ExbB proton channel family protein [Erwinia pyri]|uniref:MotA/TolQ/ExbB proton channel family protein n=1 Tax=Erwinia pyri TaxID=3062598 RepID=A0AA50HL02_9GAMM|nr:MotA/TolQ/ExbB proton channel family protein [Erwinia sp. DE2]WLS77541.1 MotA/TolQ/ExbB proton channel family protein [Erwinia sp. DE2]
MNATLMHDIIFWVMYAALVIAVVIMIERTLYYGWTHRHARQLQQALGDNITQINQLPDNLRSRPSLALRMITPVMDQATARDREALSDLTEQQYLNCKPSLNRGIWLLETIVTAAPLLGLLGTVMGIIDTFKALAASGVSDPGQVSAGMGTALNATALGIAIALLCLLGNNFLQSRMEAIQEQFKVLLIRATLGAHVGSGHARMAEVEKNRYA